MQHKALVDRHAQVQRRLLKTVTFRCSTKLLQTDTHKCSTGSIQSADTSGAHKSSSRRTRLSAGLALVAAQAAIDQTSLSTAKAAIEQTHLERQHRLLQDKHGQRQHSLLQSIRTDTCRGSSDRSEAAQVALEQICQRQHRLLQKRPVQAAQARLLQNRYVHCPEAAGCCSKDTSCCGSSGCSTGLCWADRLLQDRHVRRQHTIQFLAAVEKTRPGTGQALVSDCFGQSRFNRNTETRYFDIEAKQQKQTSPINHRLMNVEIGTEATQFLYCEYLF